MLGYSLFTRWTPRTVARVVAAGVTVAAMGLLPGAASSAGESGGATAGGQSVDTALTYTCPFKSGARQVTVRVAGAFPGTVTAGGRIRPSGVTITPILPHEALADLTALGATSVAASARMSVTVAQKKASTTAVWSSLAASAPIPGAGDLSLPGSATVPAATASGGVAFIAGPLTLALTPHTAGGGATDPAAIPLDCRLELGPNAVLAHVPMAGPGGATPSAAARAARSSGGVQPADNDPCLVRVDLSPIPGEAYMAGYSNVRKLRGAALLGVENGQTTGHVLLELAYAVIIDLCATDGSTHVLTRGLLDHNGAHALPPAKATFLTFGFMPTTATLELTQPAGTTIEVDSHSFFDGTSHEESTVTSQLSIRVHDVLVNGSPLDVGPHCESATPMAVTLHGKEPDYTVNTGGPLTGVVTIPPFTGCGVGEDLDPLLTASISGPGNFIKLTQGVPCTRPPDQPTNNCDPVDRPRPLP